ncbi:heterochromatin protein, putative [Paecilomyces variotii No. 5]|uniref:Heterochromatin protein, putative n=1 Tax=Byssochlamys spectabilis (strain No. 5 / NBRC 109023) TaxID=1356009 RepID=V5FZQ4_BYSSN|nr:heterochromatin protein, putative [Paecilomyces variotii No. 5]
MPPPVEDISEDESSGEAIPYDNGKESGAEESDEEEEGEDVYVVEKIVGHEFKKDTLLLQVKWKGYDKPEDQTLEPEANLLEGAKDALDEYYAKLGGRPEKPTVGRKRKSLNEAKATPEKTTQKKPRKSRGTASAEPAASENDDVPDWVPKSKNWEKDILKVETIMRDPDTGSLMAYLLWNNGKKSRVSIEQCYEKCPMKMLRFYEQHLVFKEG